MPELPDVEVFRQFCAKTILNRKIARTWAAADNKVIETSPSILQDALGGRMFTDVSRHGKYMFLKTDKNHLLVLHYGMTGTVVYLKDRGEMPQHAPFTVYFKTGGIFAFICIRKLGKVKLIRDRQQFIREKNLGPDAAKVNREDFRKRLGNRGIIKSALMNQKNIAGIGNIYADEILYQSAVHPAASMTEIDRARRDTLFKNMQRIIKVAVRNRADPENFPSRYLTARRAEDADCGICNGIIKKQAINGRSAYFCDTHQM